MAQFRLLYMCDLLAADHEVKKAHKEHVCEPLPRQPIKAGEESVLLEAVVGE